MVKRLVILGGGESGVGTALLGLQKGYDVFVSDFGKIKEGYAFALSSNEIDWEDGGHTAAEIVRADVVVKSPGIPETAPIILTLKEANVKVISEIEFAATYTEATIVAITGSNGKTSTASLTYSLLKDELNVALGGNIGDSFAAQVATGNIKTLS
jgi:UDP-N-acetylmuramoylalanine--D-glutamate ligase